MVLYHVTPARSLRLILREGLKTARASGPRPVIWLCDERRLRWIIDHVARCKRRDPDSMRVVRVACDPDAITRERAGIYMSSRDIPPRRIRQQPVTACAASCLPS